MNRKYFGTDGIRGRVGDRVINADFALKLGRALGAVLARRTRPLVVIGKDTRISGYMFEAALESGLAAAGADCRLLGPMPTPAVAYLTRTMRAAAGIVISASHNPHFDNGFKFFSRDGEKLADELELAIEKELEAPFSTVPSDRLGKAQRVNDAAGRYIEFCKGTITSRTSFAGLKIVLDCANGATYYVGPSVFEELGAEVIRLGTHPDGLNINAACGSLHPQHLKQAVVERGADLGIAFDGDGDRVLMVDSSGALIDGDQLLYIMAMARQAAGRLGGGVVGTLMSNHGLAVALGEAGIPFERTQVGDRFVHQRLIENGWLLGGEASGHIICLDKTTTGDAIVSALEVLEVMVGNDAPLSRLVSGMQKYPQRMINVPLAERVDLNGSKALTEAVRAAEAELGKLGRVILRPSGTEPVVRVTVEGRDEPQVDRLAQHLAAVVQSEFAARPEPQPQP